MTKYLGAAVVTGGMIAAGFLPLAKPQQGQLQRRNRQRSLHAIVVHEKLHVLSPRLRNVVPVPRPYIPHEETIPMGGPKKAQTQAIVSNAPAVLSPIVKSSGRVPADSSFAGIGVGLGNYTDCCAPPDPNGAAGSTQFVQWVNRDFAVFSKSTGQVAYGPAYGETLWTSLGGACASNNDGDPIAQYDEQAQRWVMMQPVWADPYYLCVAVSATSDATGSYYLYQIPVPGNYYPDYPKLAVWPDGYYVSYNAFEGGTFMGAYACAMDRASMLQGNSTTMQCFNSGYPNSDLLPSDLDGDNGAPGSTAAPPAGSPDYFITIPPGSTNALNLYQFHLDWSSPSNSTFTGPVSIPVASFANAAWIPQKGTSQQLVALSGMLMYRFAYRNFGSYESLVATQTVATSGGNSAIRWYEIRSPGSNPAVYQQGTFDPDSNYRWLPSIAEDKAGDIAVGYSVSSSGMYPSVRYTGRIPSNAPGTMESEQTVVNGAGSQLPSVPNWGDYSSLAVDPTDDCTFWYTNEYFLSSGDYNWSTRVASFAFPNCTGQTSTSGGGQKKHPKG